MTGETGQEIGREMGHVESDERLHAVKPGLAGPRAVCGAGSITARVIGRFSPVMDGACEACVAADAAADAAAAEAAAAAAELEA